MKSFFIHSLFFILISFSGFSQTSVSGKVTDLESGEELIGANIIFIQNGLTKTGLSSDAFGNFRANLDPGTYEVKASYIGYTESIITDVVIKAGQNTQLEITLSEGLILETAIVTAYEKPLIDPEQIYTGTLFTDKEIQALSTKDISGLIAGVPGTTSTGDGSDISIRGERSIGTNFYIDNIRVAGVRSMIPSTEIDQLQVITGGIEPQYGDVTGGIISIITKGPSDQLSGGFEIETSKYLDQFGYNLISGNISGPILKKKSQKPKENRETLIGFRFSGQYRSLVDDDPAGAQVYRVKEEVLSQLEDEPVVTLGNTGRVAAGELLTNQDVDILGYQPYEEEKRIDLTGKIDARLSKAIDVSLTGSFSDQVDRFTPRENEQTGSNWRVFNAHNNPFEKDRRYRGNFRFRHRLGKAIDLQQSEQEGTPRSLFSNVQYILQVGYEHRKFGVNDHRHGDNLFDYGYIGLFDYQWSPAFALQSDGGPPYVAHVDYTQNFVGYTPGTQNPVLANYNNSSDPGVINSFSALNGFFNGNVTEIWDHHVNVGQVYDLYQKTEEDLITINANSSFTLSPKGSEEGTHSIKFGIQFEQRFNRGYDLNPVALWRIARQQVNRNILGINPADTIGFVAPPTPFDNVQSEVAIHPIIAVNQPGQNFANSVRQLTGQANNDYVNIDGLTPDQLSLSMFSAQELNDQFALIDLDYYGFDYQGNKLSNRVSFDDFFNTTVSSTDDTRTFPVAAFAPTYAAAYIQDQFNYKDIILRLGVRIDRYDANTKVLRDPYSLYEVMNAEDFHNLTGEARAAGVEDDFKVYVADEGSDQVQAYRKDNQWYTPSGEPVNDGRLIFGGGVVTPKLYENRINDIKNRDFDPNTSFEDYQPQVNWMPRLAFSFPISKQANFIAHYDILVQRPSAFGVNVDRASALDYFYWEESAAARLPNANLKPQRTIDYEVGFQQELNKHSAIKLAAYYREMRDMIQRRSYLYVAAPVSTYETFDNIDFGTSKGFTFQYDLRRIRNVAFNASYTLQFADGTGSEANGRRGITNRGEIRTLFPLNYDERHRIVGNIDLRYGQGKSYQGPMFRGKDILAGFGMNLQAIAVSGRPYTVKQQADVLDANGTQGQINGARLPWNTTLNLRVEKTFDLVKNQGAFPLSLNVYLRAQNLLNTQNILNVYPLTGSATDDGYLSSSAGIQRQNDVAASGLNLQSYLDAYQWRVINPNFFSLPRRMYLGAMLLF